MQVEFVNKNIHFNHVMLINVSVGVKMSQIMIFQFSFKISFCFKKLIISTVDEAARVVTSKVVKTLINSKSHESDVTLKNSRILVVFVSCRSAYDHI